MDPLLYITACSNKVIHVLIHIDIHSGKYYMLIVPSCDIQNGDSKAFLDISMTANAHAIFKVTFILDVESILLK
jgi:hypothetical protein